MSNSPVVESIHLLTIQAEGAEREAQYHRRRMIFKTEPKSGGVLHQIQEMHRRDAEKAEALAADYRTALGLLQGAATVKEVSK